MNKEIKNWPTYTSQSWVVSNVMKTYVTINNDQSNVYFTGEDADADMFIKTSSLYINRTILKLCKSVQDGVVTQFMLHHVLNLQYCDGFLRNNVVWLRRWWQHSIYSLSYFEAFAQLDVIVLFCNVTIFLVLAFLFVVIPVRGLLHNKDQNHLLPKLAVFSHITFLFKGISKTIDIVPYCIL